MEADRAATAYLMSLVERIGKQYGPFFDFRSDAIQLGDGRIQSLWFRSRLIAVAVVLRDDMNRSVLHARQCVDLNDIEKPAAPEITA